MAQKSPFTLLHWGLLVIGSSAVVGAMTSAGRTQGPLSADQRAQLLGTGVAVLAGWIVGIVLIVLHFTRGRKG